MLAEKTSTFRVSRNEMRIIGIAAFCLVTIEKITRSICRERTNIL